MKTAIESRHHPQAWLAVSVPGIFHNHRRIATEISHSLE
jgi:hypothetical protein